MPLGKRAPHLVGPNDLALTILAMAECEFVTASRKPVEFRSSADLVKAWDESAARVRSALQERSRSLEPRLEAGCSRASLGSKVRGFPATGECT